MANSIDTKKKYFTKYVPTDGEVKKGDLVREPNGKIYVAGEFGEDTGFSYLYNLDGSFYDSSDFFDKIKLVVCTKEINIGDEVNWLFRGKLMGDSVVDISRLRGYKLLKELGGLTAWVSKRDAFKIVGVVRTHPVWAKEGMKLGKDDLIAQGVGVNWDDNYGRYKFSLKCPHCKNVCYL